jgi:hypothetical protein
VLRLDGNGAHKRAVAIENLAGTWNSDFDFEVLDVKKDLPSILERPESERLIFTAAPLPLVNHSLQHQGDV